MAKPENIPTEKVDYIACDVPDEMTLEQFRRERCCNEQHRFPKLRELGARWRHRQPRG